MMDSSGRKVSLAARVLPCFLTFTSSFCVMVIELVAGRLISRHVGASLYTWTSVIGVVLGGITVGNWVGGWLADRFNPRKLLPILFLLGALGAFALPHLNYMVGDESSLLGARVTKIESWPLHIAVQVTLVFLLPAAILGTIGPAVVKLALDLGLATGRTVGTISAAGALGSIAGTFVTGFYLIAWIGTQAILNCVGGVLAVVGLGLGPALWPVFVGGGAAVLVGAWLGPFELTLGNGKLQVKEALSSGYIYADETRYSYVSVHDNGEEGADRRLTFNLDNLNHSYYFPEDPTRLDYDYEKIYAAVTLRFGKGRKDPSAFFIGGGGYIFPRWFQAQFEGARVQVAEIDEGVTRAVMAELGLKPTDVRIAGVLEPPRDPEDPPLELALRPIEIYHQDARNRIADLVRARRRDRSFEPFDFVYGDAFNHYAVPTHLVTRELAEMVKEILRPETGIYLLNVIDIYVEGQFLGRLHTTLKEVFPHVAAFATHEGGPNLEPSGRDTFILVASFRPLDLEELGKREGELETTCSRLSDREIADLTRRSGGQGLTDDHAPVENLLEVVVRRADRDD